MSGKGTKLLTLCMLLLLAAGAFMPRAASSLQNHQLAAQTESRPLDGIEFTLREGGGVEQTLSLLSAGYKKIALPGGGNLTQQEVEKAAIEAVTLLQQEKLLPDFTWESIEPITAFAAVSNSGMDNTAVIWEYAFLGDNQSLCTVWIDDATRKLVTVSYVANGNTSTSVELTLETSKEPLAERWSAFLHEYYSADSATVTKAYNNESESVFTLEFTWMTEENPVFCTFPLMLRGGNVFFCW